MQSYVNSGNQQGYFISERYNNLMVFVADDVNAEGETVTGDEKGDYVAELTGHGGLLFLFQPYALTTEAQMNQLFFNITFTESTPIVYEGVSVFSYTDAAHVQLKKVTEEEMTRLNAAYANLNLTAADLGNQNELGLYYYEITFDHLTEEHMSFSDEFVAINKIDTLQKWDKLNDALLSGSLTVTIIDERETQAAGGNS